MKLQAGLGADIDELGERDCERGSCLQPKSKINAALTAFRLGTLLDCDLWDFLDCLD